MISTLRSRGRSFFKEMWKFNHMVFIFISGSGRIVHISNNTFRKHKVTYNNISKRQKVAQAHMAAGQLFLIRNFISFHIVPWRIFTIDLVVEDFETFHFKIEKLTNEKARSLLYEKLYGESDAAIICFNFNCLPIRIGT